MKAIKLFFIYDVHVYQTCIELQLEICQKSQNEKPWEKLPRKQVYITLKMNDCGQDLEKLAPFNATDAVQLLKTLSKNLTKV